MNAYFSQNTATMTKFNSILGTPATLYEDLILFVQGWLMESAWTNLTSEQLLFGWSSGIAEKANGGNYWQGADFSISGDMAPIFNDQFGPIANTPFGLYSGSFTTDNVSQIRLLNGEAYLNRIQETWNGTDFSAVPQQPNDAISNAESNWFGSASNGVQFPPYMNQDPI